MHTIIRVTTVAVSLKYLLRGQLKFLQQNGFNVIAISAKGNEVNDIEKDELCKHVSIPFTRTINPILDIICLIKLCILLSKIKPTIIHSHTPKAGIVSMLASYITKVPIRLHTIAGTPWLEETGLKRKMLKQIEKLTILASTKVYVNSHNLLDILQQNKISTKKLNVLGKGSSNGIDLDFFKVSKELYEESLTLKSITRTNENTFIWLFIGRVVKDKGIQELISAFIRLQKLFKDDQLWLVGEQEPNLDPLNSKFIEIIKKEKNIIEWGFKTDVRPFFIAADILAFPSYREGFPNVPLQAALLDCGLILSNINGCNEIVENNKNGLLVNPKDENDLFKKMLFARTNQNIIEKYKKQAKIYVSENYCSKKVWNNLLLEYQCLIKTKNEI